MFYNLSVRSLKEEWEDFLILNICFRNLSCRLRCSYKIIPKKLHPFRWIQVFASFSLLMKSNYDFCWWIKETVMHRTTNPKEFRHAANSKFIKYEFLNCINLLWTLNIESTQGINVWNKSKNYLVHFFINPTKHVAGLSFDHILHKRSWHHFTRNEKSSILSSSQSIT